MIPRLQRPRSRPWAAWALVLLCVPLIWVVFVADGWTINRLVVRLWVTARGWGWPVTPDVMDGILNTVMLLPFALLATLWLPRVRWWVWGVAGLTVSLGVEAVQLAFLPRDASLWDVLFNTVGALMGAGIGELVNRRRTGG